jgi:hypothetical protein
VVIPDLQILIERYNLSILPLENNSEQALGDHLNSIDQLFDQMVRKQPAGTMQQRPLIRFIEHLVRGDAAKAGELHQWMYDKYSLKALLTDSGYKLVQVESAFTSRIQGWNSFYLDNNEDGSSYKSDSLYMEGLKKNH